MRKVIFHIDVNSAFLSWEAKQKCPGLILVPPNYSLYEQCSQSFIDILRQYTPHVEQYSIDEAFIDMSGTEGLWGAPVIAANRIRIQISSELGFTVNIGISSNKLLAKMASDFKKPDMIHTLFPEEIERKMWLLPVSELFFVGRATNITNEIHQAACKLFDELWNGEPIRHLGIHVSRIREGNTFRQIDFFDSTDYEKLERIDATADEIRERFGIDSVKRATFVTDKKERGIDHMSGGITREKRTVDYSKIKIE